MKDRSTIQKQLKNSFSATRTDAFQTEFKRIFNSKFRGIPYYDLKINSDSPLTELKLDGKTVIKLRLLCDVMLDDDQSIDTAALYIHYADGSKTTKTILAEKINSIVDLFINLNAQKENLLSAMGKSALFWDRESVNEIYDKNVKSTPRETYNLLHDKIIASIFALMKKDKIDECNVIDLGCGDGLLLKSMEQKINEEKTPPKINKVGVDFNFSNIEACNKDYVGDCHFMMGSSTQFSEVLAECSEKKIIDKRKPTILSFSGSLTRLVLNNAFESASILQQAALNQVDYIVGGGHTHPLFNPFMLKRIGFQQIEIPEIKDKEGNFYFAFRRLSLEEILHNKIKKIKNKNFLDLTLCPNPAELLKILKEKNLIQNGLTIDLSFVVWSPQLISQLLELTSQFPKLKLICWHWDKLFLNELHSKFANRFEKMDIKSVYAESYLMAPRAFFSSVQSKEVLQDKKYELSEVENDEEYKEFILKMSDTQSINYFFTQKPEALKQLFAKACRGQFTAAIRFMLTKDPTLLQYVKGYWEETYLLNFVKMLLNEKASLTTIADLLILYPFGGNFTQVFHILSEAKIDLTQVRNSCGETLFHIVAKREALSFEAQYYLFSQYPDGLNVQDAEGRTPFHHMLSQIDNPHFTEYLKSADLSLQDKEGKSAIHYCRYNMHASMALLNLDKTLANKVDHQGNSPLHYAAKLREFMPFVIFESFGADLVKKNHDGLDPLETMVRSNDNRHSYYDSMVTQTLEFYYRKLGKSYFEKNSQLASIAFNNFDEKTILWLLQKGIDLSTIITLENISKLTDNYNGLAFLMQVLPQFNSDLLYKESKDTPSLLHRAAEQCNWEYPYIKMLSGHNINFNLQEAKGNTPAHILVSRGISDEFLVLLDEKVDLSIRNKVDDTPLDIAFRNNSAYLVTSILSHDWKLLFLTNSSGKYPFQQINEKHRDEMFLKLEKHLLDVIIPKLTLHAKLDLIDNLKNLKNTLQYSRINLGSFEFFATLYPDQKIIKTTDRILESPTLTLVPIEGTVTMRPTLWCHKAE